MPEWTLPAESASVSLARRLATESLPGVPATVLNDVALVISELVTNCVRHARTDLLLRVDHDADEVRIEVTDASPGNPRMRRPKAMEPHGRGLQIVQALSRRWGVVPATAGAGKTVWCIVTLATSQT